MTAAIFARRGAAMAAEPVSRNVLRSIDLDSASCHVVGPPRVPEGLHPTALCKNQRKETTPSKIVYIEARSEIGAALASE
jgi:hypothetical protein